MNNDSLQQLSEIYGIKFSSVERYDEKGYRNRNLKLVANDNKKYNFIIYKNEPNILQIIRNANFVSNLLRDKNFPVRYPVRAASGRVILKLESKKVGNLESRKFGKLGTVNYGCLYNYIEGHTIPWEGWTMKHLKLLGWFMAEMHRSLQFAVGSLPFLKLPFVFDVLQNQFNEMQSYFEKENVRKAMANKLELKIDNQLIQLLEAHLELITDNCKLQTANCELQTVLHMDLVRGNVLFKKVEKSPYPPLKRGFIMDNLELAGIIDFEKVAVGPGIVDVARTLAFLITDCKFKEVDEIKKYFLKSGYEKRGNGKIQYEFLDTLLLYFWLYDFYKFLLHNPYEFLESNDHYLRVRNVLLREKILAWS